MRPTVLTRTSTSDASLRSEEPDGIRRHREEGAQGRARVRSDVPPSTRKRGSSSSIPDGSDARPPVPLLLDPPPLSVPPSLAFDPDT